MSMAPSLAAVEAFVVREARLLDARDWPAWNALFDAEGIYWMPASPGQTDAALNVSLIHEGALLREVRIRRYADANAFSLQPAPRGWRMVGNVLIDAYDPVRRLTVASGRVHAVEYRRGETTAFHAFVTWHLVGGEEDLRIRLKRVDLIDCDAAHGDINLYI
jgi:3-phenylpropionate/cinnamic acid dioxygenase small subunit